MEDLSEVQVSVANNARAFYAGNSQGYSGHHALDSTTVNIAPNIEDERSSKAERCIRGFHIEY